MVRWPQHHRVVRLVIWAAVLFHMNPAGQALRDHLTSFVDSPRTVVPVRTGMRMPGSFGCGDDDEVDELIQGIRELGVKDN
jgi:hypothetical protein